MKKRPLALLASAIAAALLLGGCTANTTAPSAAPSAGDTATAATRVIVDHTGKEVTIPATIKRVAVDEIPIASTYLAYFKGSAPHLVGMSGAVVSALKGTVAADIAPELLKVDTSYYTDGDLNVESLLQLAPDVVFYNARNTDHAARFAAAGIPHVGFATTGDPATVYADWLRLLEQVFNEPGKMDDLISHGADLVAKARKTNATLPAADRKSVMIVFRYSPGTLTVAGEPEFFGSFWLATANAKNAAVGTTQPLAPVNAEQVITWNPDTILIGGAGQAQLTPKQLLDNSAEGIDLSSLTAVRKGNVYSTGLGMWSWFTPNPDAPVIANWIGAAIYPDLYKPNEIRKMTRDYYALAYGYKLSDKQLDAIFTRSFAG